MRVGRQVPAAVVAGLALDSGGYFPRAWVWSSVVLLWFAALVLVAGGRVAIDRRCALWIGAAAALTAWTLLSSVWSVASTDSVLDARRDVVYLAGAFAVIVAAERLTLGVGAAVLLTTVVGLARYLVSGPTGGVELQLLSWPVGYANAFAALAAMALPIAVATSRRAVAAAAVPLFLAVLVLTSSRGGAAAAVVALACLAALDVQRRALAVTALRLAPSAVMAVGVCAAADLTGATTHLGLRRALVAVGLAVAVAAAVVLTRRPLDAPPGRPLSRRVAAAAVLGAVIVAVLLSSVTGAGTQRSAYWGVARHAVGTHPGLGVGAGGFGAEWFAHGNVDRYGGALDAHNLYLETLAELGPVGLVLLVVFLGIPLTRARTDAVAAAAFIAFLVHALLDWDWEVPAVTLAAVLLGGTLLLPVRARALSERTRLAFAVVTVALAVAALVGLRSDALPGVDAAGAAPTSSAAIRACRGGRGCRASWSSWSAPWSPSPAGTGASRRRGSPGAPSSRASNAPGATRTRRR